MTRIVAKGHDVSSRVESFVEGIKKWLNTSMMQCEIQHEYLVLASE
jgi:hypothetical protein